MAETTLGWTYHYNNNSKTWVEARQFCQQNYTDLMVIQSQAENDKLVNLLPPLQGGPYYWIGLTKKQNDEPWTWVGNNSTWIGNKSWADNEPTNKGSEFCVELYVNKYSNRGKWNDEKCDQRRKPLCYKGI